MGYPRAKIELTTNRRVAEFVQRINSDGSTSKWMLENHNGDCRVDARSFLGVLYASTEWGGEIYFVNATNEDEELPGFIDDFRI